MKKEILLGALALIMFLPLIAFAQGPLDCCQLRKQINFENVTYNANIWVGQTGCTTSLPGSCNEASGATNASNCSTSKWGLLCLLNSIVTITDWIFYIMVIITSLLVIFGAFTIATGGGDPGKVASGRNYILYAMIGLVVGLLSRAIPAIVKGLV